MQRFWFKLGLLISLSVLFLCTAAYAQVGKRLVLKDGSYQPASKWEIKGDRVRYYSTERNDWEDVPNELIDWKATEEWNKTKGVAGNTELEKAIAEEREEHAKEEAASPVVAPGVRLPATGGVFLVDTLNGKPQLAELMQNGGEINKQLGKNILRAAINPLPMGSKQSIELKGKTARVQAHVSRPTLYIDIDQDTQQKEVDARDRFRIVKMQQNQKKNTRIVGNLKIAIWGKVSEQHNYIPTNVEKFGGDWVKITPTEPLEPGEYAVVELLGDGKVNMYVWDFGVNPSAPANSGAWKPEPVKDNPMGTFESPVLVPGDRTAMPGTTAKPQK